MPEIEEEILPPEEEVELETPEEPEEPETPEPDPRDIAIAEMRQQIEELKRKPEPTPTPTPATAQKPIDEQVEEEAAQLEKVGQWVSDDWKQNRRLELRMEQQEQRIYQTLGSFIAPIAQSHFVNEIAGDTPEAAPYMSKALKEGQITFDDLSKPFVVDALKKAALYDAQATKRAPLPSAAPVGGGQPVTGVRSTLSREDRQVLARWETELGIKYTDDMIKEAFNG
jgi:hypothetical protein